MAVKFYNFTEKRYDEPQYVGAVLDIIEHYWLDGMVEETAVCWNRDEQKIERHQVGYYGIDGRNLDRTIAEVDATPEVKREVRRSLKNKAYNAFVKSVLEYKGEIRVGSHAEVVRGRKVPKGTAVEVFWVGEKETYRSRCYAWMHETEKLCGCYGANGEKLWIKAEYLKNTDPIQSPNAKERREFIRDYIDREARKLGA